jgi:hypothetical protein
MKPFTQIEGTDEDKNEITISLVWFLIRYSCGCLLARIEETQSFTFYNFLDYWGANNHIQIEFDYSAMNRIIQQTVSYKNHKWNFS